jgi:hypothetical protein
MSRLRGWGVLLAVCVPLLIFISWSRLGSEQGRINMERFEAWSATSLAIFMQPPSEYFLRTKQLAKPGDVTLPEIPKNSGIKSWAIQPDTTLLVQLDAKVDGSVVQLRYVPVVHGTTAIFYDCVSTTSQVYVRKFCYADSLRSPDDIPAQLAANEAAVKSLPAVVTASGDALAAGTLAGSVVVVPAKAADLNNCGFQCVKPQNCANARPLACVIAVSEKTESGSSGTQHIVATPDNYRGTDLATRSAADKACVQAFGAGYSVAQSYSLWGSFKLTPGSDYWVHNSGAPQSNCWSTDDR